MFSVLNSMNCQSKLFTSRFDKRECGGEMINIHMIAIKP